VKHRANPRFWKRYESLPDEVQQLADRCYALLRSDPEHPSLHFKKIGRLRSVRIGLHYRALAVVRSDELVWFWIGTHAEYDKLLAQ
jgi:hypothetical protein